MKPEAAVRMNRKVEDHVIEAIHDGYVPDDPKLPTLVAFTQLVVEKRGWVDQDDIDAFLNAGYIKANILDAILVAAMKTISNYTNHIADTPVDDAFVEYRWDG